MGDQIFIEECQDITDKVMFEIFKIFKSNPKLILTESDLKCWMFHHFQPLMNENIHIHSEITHYLKVSQSGSNAFAKKHFFRDMTLLDPANLDMNKSLWDSITNEYTLSKGFKHNGLAVHFELKLVRQAITENRSAKIDSTDIGKLNNVHSNKRAFNFVWGSKSATLSDLKNELTNSLQNFTNTSFNKNGYLKFYLFDNTSIHVATWQGSVNDLVWETLN